MSFSDFMKEATGSVLGMVGGLVGAHQDKIAAQKERDLQMKMADDNANLQREFAMHGLRWKVADAKAAGLSPLAALGAQGVSFSPISVGSVSEPSKAELYGNMGQNLGRAISATKTGAEKELAALQIQAAKYDVEGKALENQLKIKELNNVGTSAPAFPGSDNFMPGQGNSGLIKIKPSERTASQRGRPAQDAGWVPDVGYARTDTGFTPVPSKDVKERIEDQLVPELMWAARNYLAPNMSALAERVVGSKVRDEYRGAPPRNQLPKGATDWQWSFWKQEWQPKYK